MPRATARRSLAGPLGVAALGCAGCVAVLLDDPTVAGGWLPTCPTRALLGVVCPGCGTLRMVRSVLRGDLGAAVQYNAVALVALPLLVWAWAAWLRRRWRGTGGPAAWAAHRRAPAVALVVLVVWGVVRNVPVEPFTALRV